MTKTTSILSTSLLLMAIPLAAQDAGLFPKDLGNNFKNPTLTRPAIQSNSRQIGSTQRSSIRSSKQYGNSQQARTFQSYPVPHTFVNQSLTTVDQAKAQKLQNQLRAKLIEYKSAKDDDSKKDISKQVRKLLADQFEIRLKTPSRLIEASKKKVEELSNQVSKRSEMADSIISLRRSVLLAEAKGLGWNPAVKSKSQSPFGTSYQQTFSVPHSTPPRIVNVPVHQNNPSADPFGGPAFPSAQVASSQPKSSGLSSIRNKQKKLLDQIGKSSDETESKELSMKLQASLQAEFEYNQKQLQERIKSVDKQLNKVEENLKKRLEAKDQIIDLKLETLINEANGLGF